MIVVTILVTIVVTIVVTTMIIHDFFILPYLMTIRCEMNQILLRTIKNDLKRHILGEKMYYHPSNDSSNHDCYYDHYYDALLAVIRPNINLNPK